MRICNSNSSSVALLTNELNTKYRSSLSLISHFLLRMLSLTLSHTQSRHCPANVLSSFFHISVYEYWCYCFAVSHWSWWYCIFDYTSELSEQRAHDHLAWPAAVAHVRSICSSSQACETGLGKFVYRVSSVLFFSSFTPSVISSFSLSSPVCTFISTAC